jgi:hypothetical protein
VDINDSTDVTIPIRNLIAMVAGTSIATMAYFGIQERLNTLEHSLDKSQMEIERNTEFRILWPRGELGSLPADARQDMLIEGLQIDVVGLRQIQEEVHELTIRIGTIESLYHQDTNQ